MSKAINNLHNRLINSIPSQKLKQSIIEFSNNGGVIHISEGSISTFGINQKNYEEHLIGVREINWSYPKELIEESSKADIVFSY